MPKLWTETVEAHRREVHEAILDATGALVAEHGLRGVTMSAIAQHTGIGRATLYKYFPDVDTLLQAWHSRQIARHLEQLAEVRDRTEDPARRLEAVLEAYAAMAHQHGGEDLTGGLHRGEHVAHARRHLRTFIADLIAQGASAGLLRDDVAPAELAEFCIHALSAASATTSRAAAGRLVTVTLAGLQAPPAV